MDLLYQNFKSIIWLYTAILILTCKLMNLSFNPLTISYQSKSPVFLSISFTASIFTYMPQISKHLHAYPPNARAGSVYHFF